MLTLHAHYEKCLHDSKTSDVYLRKYRTCEVHGERFRIPADDFDEEDKGQWIGEITEHAPGLYSAEVHTSEEEGRGRLGCLQTIHDLFESTDQALEEVAKQYDEERDNLVPSRRSY